jgi:transcriptional regulator with XRE-family HTH domain
MAEQDLQQPQVSADLAGASVGVRLRSAREALRLSRADIAARTKIAERHLAAIEEERYGDLASSTYAVGFSRAYARAVGLDEREIAQAVRVELDLVDEVETPTKQTFEPGDPARIPSLRTAWVAGAAALVVLGVVVANWNSYIFPAISLPDLIQDAPPPKAAKPAPAPAAAMPVTQGPVMITATQPGVWVKIVDAQNKQLFQKEMAQGESFTVPADAAEPLLRTAWPDALAVTIGGRPVPPLADKRTLVAVPVSVAALLARGAPPASTAGPIAATPAVAPVTPPPVAAARPATAAPAASVSTPRPVPSAARAPTASPSPAVPAPAAAKAEAAAPRPEPPAGAPKASPDSQ